MNAQRIIPLTALLIVLFAAASFAGPMQRGQRGARCDDGQRRMAQVVDQLTPEKQALFTSIMDEHRKDVRPLHNALWQKRTELKALSVNPNTKPETLSALVAEMAKIRTQLQDKGDVLRDKIKKDVGIDFPARGFGHGQGRHEGRRGMGMGPQFDPNDPVMDSDGPEEKPGA